MTTVRPLVSFRPADSEEDFPGILDVYRANGWSHANRPDLLRIAVDRADFTQVAVEDDTVLGFIRTMSDGAFAVYIADILVLPDRQGQGIGSQLFAAALAHYPMAQFHHQVLLAEKGAEGFYRQAGLSPVSVFGLTAFIRTRGTTPK